jgi:hypothetical protein
VQTVKLGENLFIDIKAYLSTMVFNQPIYRLSGLAPGSGFTIDAVRGTVGGQPTQADCQASAEAAGAPLRFSISVRDADDKKVSLSLYVQVDCTMAFRENEGPGSRNFDGSDEEEAIALTSTMTSSTHSKKTCKELGWAPKQTSLQVCAASAVISKVGGNPVCPPAKGLFKFSAAASVCADIGARMCTQQELVADVAANSGCDADNARVWTSSACKLKGKGKLGKFVEAYFTVAGSSDHASTIKPVCTSAAKKNKIRCCADQLALSSPSSTASALTTSTPSATVNPVDALFNAASLWGPAAAVPTLNAWATPASASGVAVIDSFHAVSNSGTTLY